jgi:hypothetical protein
MNRFHATSRLAVVLAGLAGTLPGLSAVTAPAALAATAAPMAGDPSATIRSPASPRPGPAGWNKHPPLPARAHATLTSGMPGWQITLIAAGTMLLAAVLAVIIYRARTTRRPLTAPGA